jgi:hypothetical protein
MMAHLTLDVVPSAVRMLNPTALCVRAVEGKHKRGLKKNNQSLPQSRSEFHGAGFAN